MNAVKRSRIELESTSARTKLNTIDCEFKWTVCDISKLFGSKVGVTSEELFSKYSKFSGWFISLGLHSLNDNDDTSPSSSSETYVSILVNCSRNNKSIVKLNFDMSVLNDENEKCLTCTSLNISGESIQDFGFHRFSTWDELIKPESKLLRNDSVNFLLQISLTTFDDESVPDSEKNDESRVIQTGTNTSLMFKNSELSDLTIIFDDVSLMVHKAIIANKSEVLFKKIKNLQGNEMRLPIPFPVGQELISFIYTGTCPNLLEHFDVLYTTAIRLKISDLANLIETTLTQKIAIDNVCQYLTWAENRKANNLKRHCINFIRTNIRKMITRSDFQNLTQEFPNLTRELLLAIGENNVIEIVEI